MILYFTGTGNSRFTAQLLAEKLGDEAVCVNDYIKSGETPAFESNKPWVFVCPVYVSAPAKVFCDFIKNCKFSGARTAYFVLTCAGGFGGSPAYCEAIAREKGFVFMGAAQIVMPQNYIVYFTMRTEDECKAIIEKAKPEITKLAEHIARGETFPDPGMKKWEYISTEMILGMYYKFFMGTKPFAAGDKCIGCGKCVRSCPMNNISLVDGNPQWGSICTHCMACINLCPTEAIEYGKRSVGKPRYKGPEHY